MEKKAFLQRLADSIHRAIDTKFEPYKERVAALEAERKRDREALEGLKLRVESLERLL